MRSIKSIALCSVAAAILVACGGGGNGNQSPRVTYSSMVTFGDSLSDIGTYAVGGIAASGGGRYTVNSATSKNWTELIAAQLGLPAPCSAQTGLDGQGALSVMPAVNHSGCLNYAQGGARVTNPVGPGNKLLGGANVALGQLTVPVVAQIANHLATTAGGTFSGTEIITVAAGANDIFINLASVGLGLPANTAVANMGTAGAELAGYINTQMVAKGAKYVLVSNMPDVSVTPMVLDLEQGVPGTPAAPGTQALVNTMVTTFNAQLQAGLASTAGVVIVDAYTSNRDQASNPAQYGLTNVRNPACSATNNILASVNALTCTDTAGLSNVIAGDVSHYLFADNVHPTPFGYKLFAQLVTNKMVAAGWL